MPCRHLATAYPSCLDQAVDVRLLQDAPTLVGGLVRLEPLGPEHLAALWPLFDGPELAGDSPLAIFARERVTAGVARARTRADRADWAIVRVADGQPVGEVVLFELHEEHEAMTFRIALVGPEVFDRGYGTDATRLVRDFAFGPLGLRRLSLDVDAANERARRVYRRLGFVEEGRRREARLVDGEWHDVIDMALLSSDPRP
ncbi:MAG: GNAT family protein [Dermatophilaceae bacterium]|nr:GNAT family N-acetyltransferase [Dermatophilaceae bacterium]